MNWFYRLRCWLCNFLPCIMQKEIDNDLERQKAAYDSLTSEWDIIKARHENMEVRRVS